MARKESITIGVIVALVLTSVLVSAFPLDFDITIDQDIMELGETVQIVFKEVELTDRADWTYRMAVTRIGADDKGVVVLESNGTVPSSSTIWSGPYTAPSEFPVETKKWHNAVPYIKYNAKIALLNDEKLIGVAMGKTFALVESRQVVKDYLSNNLTARVDDLISKITLEVDELIDMRITACTTGNQTDQEVADDWEALKPELEEMRTDASNLKGTIDIAVSDVSVKNMRAIDIEIADFWDGNSDTVDEYRRLVTETREKCIG